MGLLTFLNPKNAIKSIGSIIKDFINYRFYVKQIKKMNSQSLFSEINARIDWLGRVYYVINLEPETLLATGDVIDLERSRVYDSVVKIQGRFADYNLIEIVKVDSKRIKTVDFYAYLVTIKYVILSKWVDVFRVLAWIGIIYILFRYYPYVINNFEHWVTNITSILNTK